MKEKDENDKLRMQIRLLRVQGEHQDKELRSTRTKLEVEAAKKPSITSVDSQGSMSAIQTRMYEEKIRVMEIELDKKVFNSGLELRYILFPVISEQIHLQMSV